MSERKFTIDDAKKVIAEINRRLRMYGMETHPTNLSPERLLAGMNVELEHGRMNVGTKQMMNMVDVRIAKVADEMTNVTDDNRWKTAMIALAHLWEGRWYYDRLEEYVEVPMEKMLEQEGKKVETLFVVKKQGLSEDLFAEDRLL